MPHCAFTFRKPVGAFALAVTVVLSKNKPNQSSIWLTLAVAEALSPNKPNLDMTVAVAEVLLLINHTKLRYGPGCYCGVKP